MNLEKLYTEGCNFLRHYSNASQNVRSWVLVQGLLLLSACGYIYAGPHHPGYMTLISLFGLLLTVLLYLLHYGYYKAAETFAEQVIKIERQLVPEIDGTVAWYDKLREVRYRSFWIRAVTINATFTLVGVAFCICLGWGLVGLVR
jgi:hypothetical protein